MRHFLFLLLLSLFTSGKAQESSLNLGVYNSKADGLTFYKNFTFKYVTNSSFFKIKECHGNWKEVDNIVILNSYVSKATARIDCKKGFDSLNIDSVYFDFMYIDKSKVYGDIFLESDTNIVQILSLNGKVTIKRDYSITSLFIETPFVRFLELGLNFKEFNSYKCYVKPDYYPYFENVRFRVYNNQIVNEDNKFDYYKREEKR